MNALDLLEKDHKTVDGLFERLMETTDRATKTRTELFAKLRLELTLHANAEEQVLYKVLLDHEETRSVALESLEEHQIVRRLLNELSQLQVDDDVWLAKLTVLRELVEHHVEEEEEELFPDVKKLFDEDDLESMGQRMQHVKDAGEAAGEPDAPGRPAKSPPRKSGGRGRGGPEASR